MDFHRLPGPPVLVEASQASQAMAARCQGHGRGALRGGGLGSAQELAMLQQALLYLLDLDQW